VDESSVPAGGIALVPGRKFEFSQGKKGEAFVFDHTTGIVYHLNRVATRLFLRLQVGPCPFEELVEHLLARYPICRADLCRDIREFLDDMRKEGLLVAEGPSGASGVNAG